nr:hypothetical protein [Methyloferula stellata]
MRQQYRPESRYSCGCSKRQSFFEDALAHMWLQCPARDKIDMPFRQSLKFLLKREMMENGIGLSNSTRRSTSLFSVASPRAIEPKSASEWIGQRFRRSGRAARKVAMISSLSLMANL